MTAPRCDMPGCGGNSRCWTCLERRATAKNPPRYRIRRVAGAPVQLWLIQDTRADLDLYQNPHTVAYGRRVIDLPPATWLAATWHEAIDWATNGVPPQPLDEVYPEYCGWSPHSPAQPLPSVKIREGSERSNQ